jgi:hypothetical protein
MLPELTVPTIKVVIPVKPTDIPKDLVPPEPSPPGNPVLHIQLAGTDLTIPVQLAGKSTRKALRVLATTDPSTVAVTLNGVLKPGIKTGTFMIVEASLQTFTKNPGATAHVSAHPDAQVTQPQPTTPNPSHRPSNKHVRFAQMNLDAHSRAQQRQFGCNDPLEYRSLKVLRAGTEFRAGPSAHSRTQTRPVQIPE